MGGDVLQAARGRMGEILAREAPAPSADLVIAVPDSGNPAARGFARASGLPQDDGLIKNRYVARTFIQPGQELRKHGLRMKFNPLPEIVGGKRLVVVDDSIVRGNTTRQIVQMLRDAGAREVHMRISAPPIKHPCHYGIDMSTREEMIAHDRTVEEIAAELGADSLAYLSLAGVYEAVRGDRDRHCDACFSGEYPLAGSDEANDKFAFERSLPLVRRVAEPTRTPTGRPRPRRAAARPTWRVRSGGATPQRPRRHCSCGRRPARRTVDVRADRSLAPHVMSAPEACARGRVPCGSGRVADSVVRNDPRLRRIADCDCPHSIADRQPL